MLCNKCITFIMYIFFLFFSTGIHEDLWLISPAINHYLRLYIFPAFYEFLRIPMAWAPNRNPAPLSSIQYYKCDIWFEFWLIILWEYFSYTSSSNQTKGMFIEYCKSTRKQHYYGAIAVIMGIVSQSLSKTYMYISLIGLFEGFTCT